MRNAVKVQSYSPASHSEGGTNWTFTCTFTCTLLAHEIQAEELAVVKTLWCPDKRNPEQAKDEHIHYVQDSCVHQLLALLLRKVPNPTGNCTIP